MCGRRSRSAEFARVALSGTGWLDQVRQQIEAGWKSIIEPALQTAMLMRDAIREAMPANWRDMSRDEFREVVGLAELGVVNLVWAPRREIAVELASAATQADRKQVLVGCRDEILEDVTGVLAEAKTSQLPAQEEARDQAAEALEAARAYHDRAAQSLLASTLGHVLEGSLGFQRPGKASKTFKEGPRCSSH